jgi:hypothetical protein
MCSLLAGAETIKALCDLGNLIFRPAQLHTSPVTLTLGFVLFLIPPRRHPFLTGRQPPVPQMICPDCGCSAGSDAVSCDFASGLDSRLASGLAAGRSDRGQMRSGLVLIASRASRLASFTSSFIPACLLNSSSERRDADVHSPSTAPVRQPTRRSSTCRERVISARDKAGFGAGVSGDGRDATC